MRDPNGPSRDVLLEQLARPASLMHFLQTRPPEDPLASWFGRVRVALPDEGWPMFQGRLAWPLLQVNCRSLPYKPASLKGIDLFALFIDPGDRMLEEYHENGDGWLVRTYSSLDELVLLDEPGLPLNDESVEPHYQWNPPRAKPTIWTLLEVDYPDHGTRMNQPNSRDFEIFDDDEEDDRIVPSEGTKIGGWPYEIQRDPWWAEDVEHIIQIDSHYDAGWNWGDNGMAFIGRRIDDPGAWVLTWQCL